MIIDNIIGELLSNWSVYFTSSKPEALRHSLFTKGDRNFLLLFENGSKSPFACAKTSIIKNNFQPFENEWNCLNDIQCNSTEIIKQRVPRPLFKVNCEDEFGFVMSYINGTAINIDVLTYYFKRNYIVNLINQVFVLWKELLSFSAVNPLLTIDMLNHKIEHIQSLFSLSYPNDTRMIHEFHQLKSRINGLTNVITRVGPVHGDFWIGNFITSKNDLHLIDWERSNKMGLPLFDIYLFCTTLLQYGNIKSNFDNLFFRNNKIIDSVKYMIKEASLFLDINAELASILYEIFLMEMSVQGLIHYNKIIISDAEWKYRLELFLDNKELISRNFFSF